MIVTLKSGRPVSRLSGTPHPPGGDDVGTRAASGISPENQGEQLLAVREVEVLPVELSKRGAPLRTPIDDSDTHSEGGGGLRALPRLTAASFTGDYRGCVLDRSGAGGRRQEQICTCWGLSRLRS